MFVVEVARPAGGLIPPVGSRGRTLMKPIRMMLAAAGVLVLGAMPGSVRAQNASVTLYTLAEHAGKFDCHVVNIAHKTLHITISIIGADGQALSVSPPTPTAAGTELSADFGDQTVATDAYCKVEARGTAAGADLRVVLETTYIKTFNEGSQTNIPIFVVRQSEGH
jgi:hypothetical protein